MSDVSLRGVRKSYGQLEVVHGVDLDIKSGEFVVFVGPSGCGKSTLLRMIAGLEPISGGNISIGGKVVNDIPSPQRGIAMVFQSYALYPHMSVYENMAFGLKLAKTPKAEVDQRVREAARILQIEDYLDRMPKALSGGQRQRVAIGRAIVREPKIFLFDEPLSNLDAELRVAMRVEIAKLHRDLGNTMIYVTHDQTEAMTMADKIVVLRAGKIEQVGRPLDLYNRPANRFVAGFLGSPKMNFLEVTTDAGTASLAGSPLGLHLPAGRVTTLGLRPEHLTILADGGTATPIGEIVVEHGEQLGSGTLVYGRLPDGQRLTIAVTGQHSIRMGDRLRIGADPRHAHFFDDDDQALRPAEPATLN